MTTWNHHHPVRRVRKARPCDWCAERINAGDPAEKHVGVFEGDFYISYLHPECHRAWEAHPDLSDGYSPGDFARGSTSDRPEADGVVTFPPVGSAP